METDARFVGLVGLLALVPVLVYTALRGDPLGFIAAINVVLIGACVYLSFLPDDTSIARRLGAGR